MHGEAEDRYLGMSTRFLPSVRLGVSVLQTHAAHDVEHLRDTRPYHDPGLSGRQQGRSECGERVAVEDGVDSPLIGERTPERSLGQCEIGVLCLARAAINDFCMCQFTRTTTSSSKLHFPSTQPRTMRGWSSPLSKGLSRAHGRTRCPVNSLVRAPSTWRPMHSPAPASGQRPNSLISSSPTPPLRQSPRTVFKMAPFSRHRRNSSTAVAVDGMPSFAFAFE